MRKTKDSPDNFPNTFWIHLFHDASRVRTQTPDWKLNLAAFICDFFKSVIFLLMHNNDANSPAIIRSIFLFTSKQAAKDLYISLQDHSLPQLRWCKPLFSNWDPWPLLVVASHRAAKHTDAYWRSWTDAAIAAMSSYWTLFSLRSYPWITQTGLEKWDNLGRDQNPTENCAENMDTALTLVA